VESVFPTKNIANIADQEAERDARMASSASARETVFTRPLNWAPPPKDFVPGAKLASLN
jgi:hypothetical protein